MRRNWENIFVGVFSQSEKPSGNEREKNGLPLGKLLEVYLSPFLRYLRVSFCSTTLLISCFCDRIWFQASLPWN
jgi:hypothetical protein